MATKQHDSTIASPLFDDMKTAILEQVPARIAFYDQDLRFVWANRAFWQARGAIGPQRLENDCCALANGDPSCPGCPVRLALQTGEPRRAEVRPARSDGSPPLAAWDVEAAPIRDDQGTLVGVVETVRDVLPLLSAEAEEVGLVGGWEFDVDTRQQTWTDGVYAIHEVDRTLAPTLEQRMAFYTPASRPIIELALERAIDDGAPFDLELQIVTARGNVRDVHAVGKSDPARHRVYGFFQDITERKRADVVLRESEASLREAERLASLGSWSWDLATNDVSWSEGLYAINGYDPRLPPPTYADQAAFYTKEGKERLDQLVHAALERAEAYAFDIDFLRPDGQVRHVHLVGNPVQDAFGRVVRLHGTVQDITERSQAEQALLRSRESLEMTAELAHIGGWEFDTATMYLVWADETFRIHEVQDTFVPTVENAIGFYVPADVPIIEQAVQKAIDLGAPFDLELEIATARGNRRHVRAIGQAEVKEGRTVKVWGTFQDITVRKLLEAENQRKQRLLEGVTEGTTDAVYIKDRLGKYLLINAAASAAVRKPAAEVLGKDDTFLFPPEEARAIMEADRRVMEAGTTRTYEEHLSTGRGATDYLATKGPIRDASGAVIGIFGIARDITDHKKTEAALATMQKLESLGTLAGGIAHDFNNILTSILGNVSLAQAGMADAAQVAELLQEAADACQTAKGLSHQLLTFAKGGAPIVKVVDLRIVLAAASSFASRGTRARCVLELGNSPLAVNIDKEQISHVIHNLVINAAQAMPEGGDITIRAASVALGASARVPLAAGPYIRVTVADQGIGIRPEHLAKIFDPYFTTKEAGRGLGLAMCHSIVAKHGGHIAAESGARGGTTFTLYFPSADAAQLPAEVASPVLTTGTGRVLVMDDDVAVAKTMVRLLKRLGYQAQAVVDGKSALAAYAQAMQVGEPFAAVIMDLTIPGGMGGKEAVVALHALDPGAKAIVSSGYSSDPVLSEWGAHGFVGVLAKPYRFEEVAEVLSRVIDPKLRAV